MFKKIEEITSDVAFETKPGTSKIKKVSYYGNLLQIFGDFDALPSLESFDEGVLGAIKVDSIHIVIDYDKTSREKRAVFFNEFSRLFPEFNTINLNIS